MNSIVLKLAYSAGSLVAIKLVGAAANFAVVLLVVNNLSISEAGYYFYILSGIMLLSVIVRFGLDNYIIREVAQSRFNEYFFEAAAKKIYLALILSAVMTVIISFFVCSFIFLFYRNGLNNLVVIMVLLSICFQAWANISASVLQGIGKAAASGLAMSTAISVINLFLLTGINFFQQINFKTAIFTLAISNIMAATIALVHVKNWIRVHIPKYSEFVVLFSNGKDFFTSKVLQIGYDQAPVIFTGLLLGPAAVAVLGISSRISSLVGYVNISVSRVMAPIYAVKERDDKEKQDSEKIRKGLRGFGVLQIFFVIFLMCFSERLLLFFGQEYVDGKHVLAVLLINQVVLYYVTRGFMELQMVGKEKAAAQVSLIRAFFFSLAFWPASLYLDVEGVAGAVLLSSSIALVLIIRQKKA